MRLSAQSALLGSAVVLVAAGLGGTAAGTDATASAKAGRLVAFGSCGELLGYAKSQAGRLVGPWGLRRQGRPLRAGAHVGRRVDGEGRRAPSRSRASTTPAPTCRSRASTSPISSRRTARRSSRSRTGTSTPSTCATGKPRLLDTLPSTAATTGAAAVRRPAARALARRLLGRAAARAGADDDRVRAVAVDAHRGRRLRPERAARRAHADARRLVPRRAHGRRDGADRRQLAGPRDAAVRAADGGRRRTRSRRRTTRNRAVLASSRASSWLPVVPRSSGRATPRRASARSCSAATSAGPPASRASGC